MKTHCNSIKFEFQENHKRKVTGNFDGGTITSDGGALFLKEVNNHYKIIDQFAECFVDSRNPKKIEHTVKELLAQRIYGIALGYEDLIDHDEIRSDPLLATLVGKADPTGQDRELKRDKGKALAGKSTLNRLELPVNNPSDVRYKKIEPNFEMIEKRMVDVFIQMHKSAPDSLILDLDATDDLLHGKQEGRFYHGYYHNYCYMPLYIFCGHSLLSAKLRSSNYDASQGTIDELDRIVSQLRTVWPDVKIMIRADSGFCREEIMSWCEENQVEYVFGLSKNSRLIAEIQEELNGARECYLETKQSARIFKDFQYKTLDSWSRERRVIGKAEHLAKGSNPRFIVTSLERDKVEGQELYEQTYCARGDMENRIKEQQQCLFADRTSTNLMISNQLRLWFSSIAYILIDIFRQVALKGTKFAAAQCDTIRLKLFKIGALITVSVRRIWVSMSSAYAYKSVFQFAFDALRRLNC